MLDKGQFIIIGAGGHALSVADAALYTGWTIAGFYFPKESGSASILGPILSTLEEEHVLENALALGIGAKYLRESALYDADRGFPDVKVAP